MKVSPVVFASGVIVGVVAAVGVSMAAPQIAMAAPKPPAPVVLGTIDLFKTVLAADPRYPAPEMNFQIIVDCKGSPAPITMDLYKLNGFHRGLYGIPLGATCNVVEAPPKTCHWETTYKNGNTVVMGTKTGAYARFDVTNTWVCV